MVPLVSCTRNVQFFKTSASSLWLVTCLKFGVNLYTSGGGIPCGCGWKHQVVVICCLVEGEACHGVLSAWSSSAREVTAPIPHPCSFYILVGPWLFFHADPWLCPKFCPARLPAVTADISKAVSQQANSLFWWSSFFPILWCRNPHAHILSLGGVGYFGQQSAKFVEGCPNVFRILLIFTETFFFTLPFSHGMYSWWLIKWLIHI